MTVKEKINQFDENNVPFYICDYEDGMYGLCLPLDFLTGEYKNFCQDEFNRYAEEIGEPAMDDGFYTYGSGFQWRTVFRKVFENDERLKQIDFDCEMGGFFCNTNELDLLIDMGSKFREICMDKEKFYEFAKSALTEAAKQEDDVEDGEFF